MKIISSGSLFIDSHCHVNSFAKDEQDLISYFKDLYSAIDIFEIKSNLDINYSFVNTLRNLSVYTSLGVHPLDVKYFSTAEIDSILNENISNFDAVGETGIDLFKDHNWYEQLESLKIHVKYAKYYKKPIIIHCRGLNVSIEYVLRELQDTTFVFHCFGYDLNVAKKVIDAGGFISFSGILTFENAVALQETAAQIDENYILCETDSPFLAPVPFRGKKNYPSLVEYTYKKCAQLRSSNISHLSDVVKKNFARFVNMNS